jgi:hypothetical protein
MTCERPLPYVLLTVSLVSVWGGNSDAVGELMRTAIKIGVCMSRHGQLALALLLCSCAAFAQGTRQPRPGEHVRTSATASGSVATNPSSNPFQNPIGQGVPPAASSNGYRRTR